MRGKTGNIEFVDQKTEQREIRRTSLKEILDGSVLTREKVVKQLPFVLFVAFLMFLYIGNRYHTEKIIRQTLELQSELKELKAESISLASELEYLSRQSQVARLLKERGIGLVEAQAPPVKIEVKKRKLNNK
jgi:cell division protein FtsL